MAEILSERCLIHTETITYSTQNNARVRMNGQVLFPQL